ncbi:MAG: 4-hydroxy-tetrahydrodipicolinate reductase [Chlamydiia bacterium]|nr:4-hydroxy-tetrahydrodipicolinate reductase [Chlamydiia bacterium]
MKIGLIGYGKMGRAVEELAHERGHIPVIGRKEPVDCVIDFSSPTSVVETAKQLSGKGIPWVLGTTGWNQEEVLSLAKKGEIPLLYASNFLLGMALFRRLAKAAAILFSNGFEKKGIEIHHKEKKDTPSGSACRLMEEIPGLEFTSIRAEGQVGTHELIFSSNEETIELTHRAKSRRGFAEGAVIAAEYLLGKTGIYTFDDVIEEQLGWNSMATSPLL